MLNLLVDKTSYDLHDLAEIVRILRAPNGCPWDAEQTHLSLRRNLLEEAYEVVEAIDENSPDHLKEELGDLLLQVVFHADISRDEGQFDLNDVADGICKKLIFRHPHVFGDVSVSSSGEVLVNWEELKRKEKGQKSNADAVDSVARSLPALWRAEKVQKKAAKCGFDWDKAEGAADKLCEEAAELRAALNGDGDPVEELGDLLFSAVNVARFLKADPEDCLHAAADKFAARFRRVEELALAQGKTLEEMSLAEMDELWDSIKHQS